MDELGKNIAESADKLLFSEDVVSYVMTRLLNTPYEAKQASSHREFIYDAFNENVKVAIDYLYDRIQKVNGVYFDVIRQRQISDRNIYMGLALELKVIYFEDGFDPKFFLYYCIEISIFAALFKNNGLQEAPDIAVICIFESLQKYDMFCGGWNALDVTATRYACLSADSTNILTPEPPHMLDNFENIFEQYIDPNDVFPNIEHDYYLPQVLEDGETSGDEDYELHEGNSGEPLIVSERISTENPNLNCASTSNASIQPLYNVQNVAKDNKNSSVVKECNSKTLQADLAGTMIINKAVEDENDEMRSMSEQMEILDGVQVAMDNNKNAEKEATCESEMHVLDAKCSSIDHEETGKHYSMLTMSMINDELQIPPVRDLTDNSCKGTKSGHDSKECVSYQIPTESVSNGDDGEASNLINTSTKALATYGDIKIQRAKRSSGYDKENSGKKLRLSAISKR